MTISKLIAYRDALILSYISGRFDPLIREGIELLVEQAIDDAHDHLIKEQLPIIEPDEQKRQAIIEQLTE